MQEIKCNFSPRFVIKFNKYVYRTKVQLKICICSTKFIKMKIYISGYCLKNIA